MTSDQAPVLWPFIAAPGLPPTGAQMGIDVLSGGSFYLDPFGWVLRDDVPVTNPNVICFGKPGRGKSATTKAFILRMMDFGYRTLILGDPKDEYEPLCAALGVQPFRIGPGLPARINPLAFGPLAQGWDHLDAAQAQARAAVVFGRWLTLIRGLVGSQRVGDTPVPFGPVEENVVKAALRLLTGYTHANTHLAETTIPALWQLLNNPTDDLVHECRYASTRHFLDETRLLRDALGQLISGALAGIFDQPTSIDVDWAAPIQSLSLSRLEPLGDEAVGIALTCLSSWGRGMRELADPGDLRIMVRDEVWKQMRLGVEAVKSFDGDLRLSRSHGDVQWANAHKPSDLLSVGDAGSQAVAIAKDLLHLADIKILHGQDLGVARDLEQLMGLGPIARDVVTSWAMHGKGRALWCVGEAAVQGPDRAAPHRGGAGVHQRRHRRRRLTGAGHVMKKALWLLAPLLTVLLIVPLGAAVLLAAVITPAAAEQARLDACSVTVAASGSWRPPFQQAYTRTSAFGMRFHPINARLEAAHRGRPGLPARPRPGRRRRGRHRHGRRLPRRLRQRRRHRPRRRHHHPLRPPRPHRHSGSAPAPRWTSGRSSVSKGPPAPPPGTTSTSRSSPTAPRSTPCPSWPSTVHPWTGAPSHPPPAPPHPPGLRGVSGSTCPLPAPPG